MGETSVNIEITRFLVQVKVDGEHKIHEISSVKEDTYTEKVTDINLNDKKTPKQQAIEKMVSRIRSLNTQQERAAVKKAQEPGHTRNKLIPMKKWVVTSVK
jgi:superfamily I DNA and RNA helicase